MVIINAEGFTSIITFMCPNPKCDNAVEVRKEGMI